MPYDPNEDDEILNGTIRQWLAYKVLPYKIAGKYVAGAAVLIAFLVGLAL